MDDFSGAGHLTRHLRLRRSLLMTPGNRAERLERAISLPADVLIFDLEDSIPPPGKPAARTSVVSALNSLDFHGKERCVRINGLLTEWMVGDLSALPWQHVDSIMVPKVERAEDLVKLDFLLDNLEVDRDRERPVELIVTLETARGILNALPIADASRRTSAMFFGSGDYAASTNSLVTDATQQFPRSNLVAAASAAGLQAIDAAFFADVKDADAARHDAVVAREYGFSGKVVFHPNQLAPINAIFSPTDEQVHRAREMLAAYREGLERGHGTSVTSDGKFVAVDFVIIAERTLKIAELIAQREADVLAAQRHHSRKELATEQGDPSRSGHATEDLTTKARNR
jgi:citrate lyase beta subunit